MKMSNLTKSLSLIVVMAASLASCDSDVFDINGDPFKDQKYIDDTSSPISIYLNSDPEFTEYVKALRYSGTYSALNQSTTGVSFTALAPNNDAMRDFYQRRGVDSLQMLSAEYVREFVLYHTISDSIPTETFVTKSTVTNLSGDVLSITIDDENPGMAYIGNEGRIIEMGISAYNGKIYVMSSALTPLVETVYDRAVESGTSSIMCQAIDAAGYAKTLDTFADTIVTDGSKSIRYHYYTLFDVTDATFAKAGITSLQSLRDKIAERDSRGLSTDSLLREYVAYHILNNSYATSELGDADGDEVTTKLLGTMANNQTMMLSIDPAATGIHGKYTLNSDDVAAHFDVNASDVRARNGYMHTIDSWLPVWEPEQTEVLWDLADYTEVKSIVIASDPELYQPAEAPSKETSVTIDNASCYIYEMGESGTKNTSYGAISYVTTKSYKLLSPQAGEISEANNNDRVVFNLGYMGSVSMKTPTIVKGKYKVEISICYVSTLSFMRTQSEGNGGLLKVAFDDNDGNTTFCSPYTGVSSAYLTGGIFTTTMFDEVEFDETSSHTFKMIVMDPAASSNKSSCIQIDCIRFIPIR